MLRRHACRYYADLLVAFGVDNDDDAVGSPASQEKAVLAIILGIIELDERERVLEGSNRLLKAHAMPFEVGSRLGGIPLKSVR
jgi:hypothetical protein